MGRRRKRKLKARRPKRTLPRVFQCPHCGKTTLTIQLNRTEGEGENIAIVRCGSCGLYYEMKAPAIFQPVDVYAKFVDLYHAGEANFIIKKVEEETVESETS